MGLFDAFTGRPAKEAAAKNAALYQRYGTDATRALDTGLEKGADALTSGIASYAPLSSLGAKYGRGSDLYMDALGINGPEGTARGQAAFTTSPGYNFMVDQATDRAQRGIARFAPGGNEAAEIARLASGYAGSEFGNWLTRVGGFVPQELQATTGAAGGQAQGYGALAGLYGNDAMNRSNVFGQVASGAANSNTAAANAEMAGSSNLWNGLFSLAGNATKAFAPIPKPA
jgi:hypothetical protein